MTRLSGNNQKNGNLVTENSKVNGNPVLPNSENQIFDLQTIDQQFGIWRRQLQDIANQMRQASDLDTLVKIIVREVREQIACDRALIYRFNSLDSGVVIAESKTTGWTPTLGETLPSIIFNLETSQDYLEYISIDDIDDIKLSYHQRQLLEKFQVKASLSLPILVEGKVWGLLVVKNCASARQWQEMEISLLSQITKELTYRLQSFAIEREQQQQVQVKKYVAKVIDKILNVSNVDRIFQTTTEEIRQLLKCDRLAVYQFNPDWSGEYVAESVGSDWVPLVGPEIKTVWEDTYLQDTQGGRYAKGESLAVNDIYQSGHSPCHIEILEQFQVKAYILVPILSGEKLWGLLAAYQNSGTRDWEPWEVMFLTQVGMQFGLAVSQAEYLEQVRLKSEQLAQIAEHEKALTKIVNRIRQSLSADTILKIATQEIRQLLKCDRVSVYRFNPDWSGEYVAESVGSDWVPLVGPEIKTVWEDTHLQETQGGRYAKGESLAVNDIYQAGHSPCHIEILEQFEVRAYIVLPILSGQKLWGLLAAYQNSSTRDWQPWEVMFLTQIAMQFGLAISQAEYLEQVRLKSEQLAQIVEHEKSLTKIVNRIRQSLNSDSILKIVTLEVRQLLKCDRVVVYRFNPEWSGEFVAESVGSAWIRVVGPNLNTVWEDTYLKETQGGRYAKGENLAVNDIYQAGHSPCHIEMLEQLEVKAYIIVPVLLGEKLWGLLAAYQNSSTRDWQPWEVSLLARIGDQFGLVLQQTEYLQQLQDQSAKLAEVAAREKAAKEFMQQTSIKLLAAVRPALDGDLTVRAPITEDELGTIADAYNNTLQALREIVIQVQKAAQQVVQTSSSSDASLIGLTNLAQQQSEEITVALSEVQQMVDSTQAVASSAELVKVAVQQANQTVESGEAAMNRTVEAIQAIRETVAQTSKKIKRLSESSQKISKVVNLISNFATQTNVLALNAAIEATRAGEYGKGFAVVADEVRSLSRQSAAATIEIEKLVQEIQDETGEVAVAMQTGIQQVVEGTNLVSETRQNLNAIVAATAEINQLLQMITKSTDTQMSQSVSVTTSMKDVAKIAHKTFAEAHEISAMFQQLSGMAKELLASVGKFKTGKS